MVTMLPTYPRNFQKTVTYPAEGFDSNVHPPPQLETINVHIQRLATVTGTASCVLLDWTVKVFQVGVLDLYFSLC